MKIFHAAIVALAAGISPSLAYAQEPEPSPAPELAAPLPPAAAREADPERDAPRRVPPATHEKRFVPTFAMGLGGQSERLELNLAGTRTSESRSDLRLTTMIGLAHPIASFPAGRTRLDGHAAVGFGPTFVGGRWQVPLREDVTFAYDATSWLTLRGGLGAGIVVDATRSAMSYGEVALPVGVTFFGTAELVYRPYLSVPLGGEDRTVFGGSQTRSASPALVPIELALRLRWARIGF